MPKLPPAPSLSLIPLFLGGCLLLLGQTPLRAQPFLLGTPSAPNFAGVSSYNQYLVYVKGDSELLLEQVARVQPEAFVRQYGGRNVIQVGIFNDRVLAERQEAAVEAQYIDAEITTLQARGNLPSVEAPPPPPDTYLSEPCTPRVGRVNDYLVVIPAKPQDLYDIEQQVIRLGAPTQGVCDRDKPRGYHIAVGPFPDRDTAERWNRYLLDFGMKNARVYYGK